MNSHRARRPHWVRVAMAIAVVCLLYLVGTSLWAQVTATREADRADTAEQDRDQALRDLHRYADVVSEACEDDDTAEELGAVCADVDDLQGPEGIPGPPPTDEQVEAAVARYCDENDCTPPGPTRAQVVLAVSIYCAERDQCRGDPGADGSDGSDGRDGPPGSDGARGSDGTPGAQGPGPSEAQIAAAVDAYCAARNECRGPAGPAGEDGADGQDGSPGRGIASVAVEGSVRDCHLVVIFTDGDRHEEPINGMVCLR